VGVGLGLEELFEKLSDGTTLKTVRINEIIRGSSAEQSGCLKLGDEVVEVSGALPPRYPVLGRPTCFAPWEWSMTDADYRARQVEGMNTASITLDQIRERIAGRRGTKISMSFCRKGDDGRPLDEFSILFKRGAWGPEHCVRTPEEKDMSIKSRGHSFGI